MDICFPRELYGYFKRPGAKLKDAKALEASDPKIITSVIGPNEIHLYERQTIMATGLSA